MKPWEIPPALSVRSIGDVQMPIRDPSPSVRDLWASEILWRREQKMKDTEYQGENGNSRQEQFLYSSTCFLVQGTSHNKREDEARFLGTMDDGQ